jgi:hypothetical protein
MRTTNMSNPTETSSALSSERQPQALVLLENISRIYRLGEVGS